jgi:integrase
MPRSGKRKTIERGIYRDGPKGGYEVRVVIGGFPYTDRLPPDATIEELRRLRSRLEAQGRTETPRAERGTLRAAVSAYLKLVKHLATWDDREDHLRRWCELYGDVQRHRITSADVLKARVIWIQRGLAPKTINHYVGTLRNLYHRLDGKRMPTPCDEVDPLPVPKTPIYRIAEEDIIKVDQELQKREQSGFLRDAKQRARFRVLVSTGKRPCEVMRALPGDVSLESRVWVPRDAKGGFCPGLYLNDDMLAAWVLFAEADAWGPYNHGAFARTVRAAGWPEDVPVYQARHNTWIAASERGADLADISAGAGHRNLETTRQRYVPILNSRMQKLGETLEGRFRGWPVVLTSVPGRKSLKEQQKRKRA